MKPCREDNLPINLLVAFMALLVAPVARAQHSLVVIRGNGIPGLVKAAIMSGDNAQAEVANWDDTSLHPLPGAIGFTLGSAPLWASGFMDVSHLAVEIVPGEEVLRTHGYLKSDTALPNCVIAIVAKSLATKKVPEHDEIQIYPIPPAGNQNMMPSGEPVYLERRWGLGPLSDYSHVTWELRFFSNGLEVPTTSMKPEEIAAARSKTDAYLLHDHPATMLFGRRPTYPEDLKARNISGSATLRFVVGRCGDVDSVKIVSATAPAFGEAAANAAEQWLFTPAVQNHRSVEQTVEFPIEFKAPKAVP